MFYIRQPVYLVPSETVLAWLSAQPLTSTGQPLSETPWLFTSEVKCTIMPESAPGRFLVLGQLCVDTESWAAEYGLAPTQQSCPG